MDLTAGSIESAAGRPLRRCHARAEYFTGGAAVIQLDAYPIAKVHSVRESATRNFDTVGAYQELVEGTDFVVDPGPGGQYGETGQLRRIGGRWLGSKVAPGCVRVVYTGGYKTDGEAAMENGTANLTDVLDFCVDEDGTFRSETEEGLFVTATPPEARRRGVLRFAMGNDLLPVWRPIAVTLRIYAKFMLPPSVGPMLRLLSIDKDPQVCSGPDIYAAIGDADDLLAFTAIADGEYHAVTVVFVFDDIDLVAARLSAGATCLSLGVDQQDLDSELYVASSRHSTLAYRPSLAVQHRPLFPNAFPVPDDLRNANLLQAVHEYMTRRTPGMISQATRGTIMPSGASYLKTAADLLPEVQRIALGYRRLF
ncbi:MAG: hypothetical protein JXO22_15250 [Phycisphaerae bacterium]|nr:hypothetical protein [Phycisphaerae bacterium]